MAINEQDRRNIFNGLEDSIGSEGRKQPYGIAPKYARITTRHP